MDVWIAANKKVWSMISVVQIDVCLFSYRGSSSFITTTALILHVVAAPLIPNK